MEAVVVNEGIDWSQQDQRLNEYDRMFCQILFYCLADESRKAKKAIAQKTIITSTEE